MLEQLQNTVYIITNLLLWPVVILLLCGMAHTLFLLGTTIMEWWQRRIQPRAITSSHHLPDNMKHLYGVQEYLKQQEKDGTATSWLILDRTEAALAKRISRARMWVRLGPALGLAGTLIPLGSALTALAANDLELLSERLILAFGTTVIGLIAGAIAWLITATLERWYTMDISELRHGLEVEELNTTHHV